jgi:hypothetical protein
VAAAVSAPVEAAPASWTADAWIFASLVGDGSTTLRELLWRADYLNHAIPTAVEIRSALRHLHARGLVAVRGRAVRLTTPGREIHKAAFRSRRGLFSIVRDVDRMIRSSPLPRGARARPDLTFVSAAALGRAYAEYAAAARALRKRRPRSGRR